jgi:hypothetical protein
MPSRLNFSVDKDSGEAPYRQFPWLTLFLVLDIVAVFMIVWYFNAPH